jgi:hypothetical protein
MAGDFFWGAQAADRVMCVEIWFEYEREDQHEQEHELEQE